MSGATTTNLDPATILPAIDALRADVQAFQGASSIHAEAVTALSDAQAAVITAQQKVNDAADVEAKCSDDVTAALAHLDSLINPQAALTPPPAVAAGVAADASSNVSNN